MPVFGALGRVRSAVAAGIVAILLFGVVSAEAVARQSAPAPRAVTPRLVKVLGIPRPNSLDSEVRADFVIAVPAGTSPSLVQYDWNGDGTVDITATLKTGPGIDQEYQIVRREPMGGGEDWLTITLRGDGAFDNGTCPNTPVNLHAEVTVSGTVINVPMPMDQRSFNPCPGNGRPLMRLPWDNVWNSPDGNSQDGWGAVTSDGKVPGNKFILDADNPLTTTTAGQNDCGITDAVWYQFVREDGSPTLLTPNPVRVSVVSHHNDVSKQVVLPAEDFGPDGPGYYKLLAWPEARSLDGSVNCAARTWTPGDLTNSFQVGSVFFVSTTQATLSKAFSPATVPVGGTTRLTYTISTATGATGQNGLAFTDTLPPGLVVAPTPATATTCGGTVTASGGTVSFSGGSIGPGPKTCTVSVDVTSSPTMITATACPAPALTNGADRMSGLAPSNLVLASGFGACVSMTGGATLVKSADRTSAAPGQTITYKLVVSNPGTAPIAGFSLSDDVSQVVAHTGAPTALTAVASPSTTVAAPQYDAANKRVTWAGSIPAASGGTPGTVTLTYTVKVNDPTAAGTSLTNTASSTPGLCGTATPSPCQATVTVGAASADLSVGKMPVGSTRVGPGQTFQYTVTATNAGPSTAVNAKATDTLPAALSFVSSADGCTAGGQTVTCGPEPALASGSSKSWTFTVRLDPAYTGNGSDIANQATVSSDTTDPNTTDNTGPSPGAGLPGGTPAAADSDLALSKTSGP
ncbi:DUF7933 domain-containing protein [Streptomyces laurentii]|uniref:DUF7933 domain-containing protein n=1 Tax=Streptomyces laurentii TaxID=39478 RepID=UPI0036C6CCD0